MPSSPPRIFLLSPARLDGKRAHFLFHPVTMFPAARALHSPAGATIGEIFTFLSGLYFRGKLAYAEAVARRPHGRADLPALSHGDARCGFCLASLSSQNAVVVFDCACGETARRTGPHPKS